MGFRGLEGLEFIGFVGFGVFGAASELPRNVVRTNLSNFFPSPLKGLYWEPQTGNPKNIVGI